jgi:tyrosine-protein kinase Etk/Wzc
MTAQSNGMVLEPGAGADDEISLVDVLTGIGQEKRLVAWVTGVAGLVGLAVALLIPPTFTARTTLLPPQQAQSASSAVAASLGALAATAGLGAAFKAPEELYVGLLKSDSVANDLVQRFNLRDRYEVKLVQDARRALTDRVRFTPDRKSSLITVEVDDKDPAFAAQLANAYVEELRKLMTRIAVTEAQQRRLYFEQQIERSKADLARAELAVKQAQEKSGLISLDAQTQSSIITAAQLRAQIVAREVQVRSLQPYAGPENPELRRLLSELAGLRAQLAKIENGPGEAGAAAAAGSNGSQALANVRIFRELKYQEAIYSAMLQQLQLAKADEARDAPLVQQVDAAFPPERKSKPRRAVIVLVSVALGLLVGLSWALLRHAMRRANADPASARQWHDLARAWSWRRG